MKWLSFLIGLLGLFTYCDVYGHEEGQAQARTVTEPIVSNWAVKKTKSTLTFSGVQSGEAFTGSFSDFDAVIYFDPDSLENAEVVVTIDMNSASTGDVESTDALPGKEWFNVRKFPVAQFKATDFTHLENDKYEAKGNLSIKDVTQSIHLPFTLNIENGYASMDAGLNLNRPAYKIGTGMWASKYWVEHSIAVNVHLEAVQIK